MTAVGGGRHSEENSRAVAGTSAAEEAAATTTAANRNRGLSGVIFLNSEKIHMENRGKEKKQNGVGGETEGVLPTRMEGQSSRSSRPRDTVEVQVEGVGSGSRGGGRRGFIRGDSGIVRQTDERRRNLSESRTWNKRRRSGVVGKEDGVSEEGMVEVETEMGLLLPKAEKRLLLQPRGRGEGGRGDGRGGRRVERGLDEDGRGLGRGGRRGGGQDITDENWREKDMPESERPDRNPATVSRSFLIPPAPSNPPSAVVTGGDVPEGDGFSRKFLEGRVVKKEGEGGDEEVAIKGSKKRQLQSTQLIRVFPGGQTLTCSTDVEGIAPGDAITTPIEDEVSRGLMWYIS